MASHVLSPASSTWGHLVHFPATRVSEKAPGRAATAIMNPAGSEETRRHPGGRKTSSARKGERVPGTEGSRPEGASPGPASFAEADGWSGRWGGEGRPGPRGGRGGPPAGVGAEGSFCVSKLERECAELSLLPPAWSPPTPGAGLTLGALLPSETASVPTY